MAKKIIALLITFVLISLVVLPISAVGAPGATLASEASVNGMLKSSTDIIKNAKDLSDKVLVYEGEIIGDIMRRGDHVWINVSDGKNAIGIWLTVEQAKNLTIAGKYDAVGDIVRVTGRFSRACPEHGGDYDIHAQLITKVKNGYPVNHTTNRWFVVLSLVTLLAAIIVMLFYLKRRHVFTGKRPIKPMKQGGSPPRLP